MDTQAIHFVCKVVFDGEFNSPSLCHSSEDRLFVVCAIAACIPLADANRACAASTRAQIAAATSLSAIGLEIRHLNLC